MKYKFIITGGNFNNKGAQAMTYIVISELRNRFANCDIIMNDVVVCPDKMDNSNLNFERRSDGLKQRLYLSSGIFMRMGINLAMILKGKAKKWKSEMLDFKALLNSADAIIDVSGYAIGSNWSFKSNMSYIYLLKMSKKYNIPIYLFPQSFGPFDYKGIKGCLIDKGLKKYLTVPRIIFARESAGERNLSKYGLSNIQISTDIVLQNKQIDFGKVLKCTESNNIFSEGINLIKGVGIVPSVNNFRYDNSEIMWKVYEDIILLLKDKSETVYLVSHSGEDLDVCRKLKNRFPEDKKVVLIDHELSFVQFEKAAQFFKYMISSRFHSVVLGYKHYIPSVVLGWAVKYNELALKFGQENYVVSTSTVIGSEDLLTHIEKMQSDYKVESENIRKKLSGVQERNCFDEFEVDFRKLDYQNCP